MKGIQVNDSEIIVSKNQNGYYQTFVSNKLDNNRMQVGILFNDRQDFENGTIIRITKGFLTYNIANAYGVFNKITKKWYPHMMPQIRVLEYEILGNAMQFATKEWLWIY